MKFKPLKDRVFVKYTEEGEKTPGGLYIPDSAKEKPQKGLVEAVGSEVKEIKVGNTILFDKYSAFRIDFLDPHVIRVRLCHDCPCHIRTR